MLVPMRRINGYFQRMTPMPWFAVLALLFLGHALPAQVPLVSKRYDAQSGMVDAVVGIQGIVQDDAGYLWVATQDGVLRFDGRTAFY
jgi:ligand-binding sensor domain-containing protein